MLRKPGFLSFLLAAGLSMAALPAMGAQLAGYVSHVGAVNSPHAPAGTWVKVCYDDGTAASASGQGDCVKTQTGLTGDPAANAWHLSVVGYRSYWVFSWNDSVDWGSPTSLARVSINGATGIQVTVGSGSTNVSIESFPRPFKPTAIYPTNGLKHVPLNFTLKWTSGLDTQRVKPGWPVTYDIYANGAGAAERLVLSNIFCNPDPSGYCSYPITNLVPAALYYWRVEAKLNPLLGTPGNPYYTSSSTRFTFAAHGTTYSLQSYDGSFVGADGCGNSTVSAKSGSVGDCETLTFYDLNGGTLESGDAVWINIYGQPYNFTASYGGGSSLYATSQWGGSYETFTFTKTSGFGTLQDGDQVTMQAFYGQYCAAEGGGGARVNCNRVAVGPWETFTLGIMP